MKLCKRSGDMVKHKKKDVFYLVLIVVSTAAVFFTAGAFTADFFETTRLDTTVIEYVPATAPTTITTTNAPTTTMLTTTETVTITTTTKTSGTTSTTVTTSTTKATTTKAGKININIATKEELMTISGIGEVYATRIIEYREQIGYFTCLEELLEVKGIGEKRLEKWEPYLTV